MLLATIKQNEKLLIKYTKLGGIPERQMCGQTNAVAWLGGTNINIVNFRERGSWKDKPPDDLLASKFLRSIIRGKLYFLGPNCNIDGEGGLSIRLT